MVSLSLLIAGCAPGRQPVPPPDPGPIIEAEHEFSFGSLLGRSATWLDHEYRLTNRTDRRINLKPVNGKPCCGRVELAPTTLGPDETAILKVSLRIDQTPGVVSHLAIVETDHAAAPKHSFSTVANVVPRHRIEAEPSDSGRLLPGDEATLSFTVFAVGSSVNPAPEIDDAMLRTALPLAWSGPRIERGIASGLIERSRSFTLKIKADGVLGLRNDRIEIVEGANVVFGLPIRWEVAPAVKATPSGLLLRAGGSEDSRTIILRSQDQTAFEIVGVESDSPWLQFDFKGKAPAPTHSIRVHWEPGKIRAGYGGDIQVKIDHPRQKAVKVGVLSAAASDR